MRHLCTWARPWKANLALMALVLGTSALAQSPECRDLNGGSRDALLGQQAELQAAAAADPDPPATPEQARRRQQLVELAFQLACLRPDLQSDPLLTRSPSDPTLRYLQVPVFFATNRRLEAGSPPERAFGGESGDRLHWGSALVSIPTQREPGDMATPATWKLEFGADANRHFVLRQLTHFDGAPSFARAVKADAAAAGRRSILLFVHGYRVTFEEAALRAAQLAHDLGFRGVPMLFSWPSAGSLLGYARDEESVELAETHYASLLESLATLGFDDVYVLGHSMGTRLVTRVQRQRIETRRPLPPVRELMLAAADLNARLFTQDIAPILASQQPPRVTLYSSANDVALIASKILHRFPRVGDTRPEPVTFAPFETIDASATAPIARAFGHSYVFDSRAVLADMRMLLQQGLGAGVRPLLKRVPSQPVPHWRFP